MGIEQRPGDHRSTQDVLPASELIPDTEHLSSEHPSYNEVLSYDGTVVEEIILPEPSVSSSEFFPETFQPDLTRFPETDGYPPRARGGSPRRIELPIDEIVRLYTEEGWSSERIAEEYDVSGPTIRDRLHKAGVEVQWGGYRTNGARISPVGISLLLYCVLRDACEQEDRQQAGQESQ